MSPRKSLQEPANHTKSICSVVLNMVLLCVLTFTNPMLDLRRRVHFARQLLGSTNTFRYISTFEGKTDAHGHIWLDHSPIIQSIKASLK